MHDGRQSNLSMLGRGFPSKLFRLCFLKLHALNFVFGRWMLKLLFLKGNFEE